LSIRTAGRWTWLVGALGLVVALTLVAPPQPAAPLAQAAPLATELDQRGGYVSSLEVAGAVTRPRSYSLEELRALPFVDVTHRCLVGASSRIEDHGYRGVLLWSLLAEAGIERVGGPSPQSVRSYVVATASDGFEAIVTLSEIDPLFDRREVVVAYERDGQLLDQSLGMAQLVVPTDTSCERDVFWLMRLEVRHIDSPPRTGR
jgi:DMSO/TMAO reductase YedYZ molybdopterin-dependent catalytic subunit